MKNAIPLSLYEPNANRRLHARLPRRFSVQVLNIGDDPAVPPHVEFVSGEAMDVSTAGLCVYVPYDVGAGREMGMVVRQGEDVRVLVGRVKWKRPRQNGIFYGLHVKRADPSRLR